MHFPQSYYDAQDALIGMRQAGNADGRRIARTHLDRALEELRSLAYVGTALDFERNADLWEADMQRAEALHAECAAARAEGGLDAEMAVLVRHLAAAHEGE